MFLTIRVKPNKKENKIIPLEGGVFEVWTKKPSKEGEANEDSIKQVARYLKIPKSTITIVRGHKNKEKVLEVL